MVIAGSLLQVLRLSSSRCDIGVVGRACLMRELSWWIWGKEPDTPGAWLDLATLRCSLGDADEANRLFKEIKTLFPPEIWELLISSVPRCQSQGVSTSSGAAGRGFTNPNQGISNPNISLGSGSNRIDLVVSPDFRPKSGQYTFFLAEHSRELRFWRIATDLYRFERVGMTNCLVLIPLQFWSAPNAPGSLEMAPEKEWWRQRQPCLRSTISQPMAAVTGCSAPLPGGWQSYDGMAVISIYPSFPEFNSNIFELRNSIRYQVGNVSLQGSVVQFAEQ